MKRRLIPSGIAADEGAVKVRSDDGTVEYMLMRDGGRLWVQRVLKRYGTTSVVQATSFADVESFTHWCDADAVRFEHPLVHVKLKRCGVKLFVPA